MYTLNYIQVCEHFHSCGRGGGQNQRVRHTGRAARPMGETCKGLIVHIKAIALPSLLPEEDPFPVCHDAPDYLAKNLNCPICVTIYDSPIELSCGYTLCACCCCKWLQFAGSPMCPGCYGPDFQNSHILCTSAINPPSSLLTSLLDGVLVTCRRSCGKLVTLGQYIHHLEANCRSHYSQATSSPSKMTVGEVMAKSRQSPATPVEVRLTEHLVRRMMDQSGDSQGVVKVPTRGQVTIYSVSSM